MDMPVPPGVAWGKLWPRKPPFLAWHGLADHCADVAATAEMLLQLPVVAERLAALAGVPEMPAIWVQRLCALAYLHDFGKANLRFQAARGGHIEEAAYIAGDPRRRQAAGLDVVEPWAREGRYLLGLILGHHGACPDLAAHSQLGALWTPTGESDPLATVRALVEDARRAWPQAFTPEGPLLPDLETCAPFWHAVLGLLQMADWLGSDAKPDAFPFTAANDPPRLGFARARAAMLSQQLGLATGALHAALPPALSFGDVSPHTPSPAQVRTAEMPGPIVILEAETGAGKTEAALWRFARLFAEGRVDGLYFALPTRVAATALHLRVQAACDRLFGAGRVNVVRALPGDAAAGTATVRLLPEFEAQWSDDPDEATRRTRWAAERPKRFLAATVAVGTIDQALLGTVRVKHAQMRCFCLSRALLVVDEVHASDTYMSTLLGRLLQQHTAAGGEALLLSATLGAGARAQLLAPADRQPAPPGPEEAEALPYPALSHGGQGPSALEPVPGRGSDKPVEVEPFAAIDAPDEVAARALAAAADGAKVMIVRNLVRDAVATFQALAARAPDHPALFRVDGIPTLHHGRFAPSDRWVLDAAVEAAIGKVRPEGALILIGTQTLEQSLDIDADLLITDLAPIDVLLQRIGRLHRHPRPRPAGCVAPRAVVLVPQSFEAALRPGPGGTVRSGPHGLGGVVYGNLPSLMATRALIGDGARWHLPADNRRLVEQGTHPQRLADLVDRLAATDPRWRDAENTVNGRRFAQRAAANHAAVDWQAPVFDFRLERDEFLTTRLGLADRELPLDPPPPSPFPSAPAVERLVIPEHLARGIPADAVPTGLTPTPTGFTFRLGDTAFTYDPLGLRPTPP